MSSPQIPPHVIKILDLLEQNGATDVLLVGGFVRDSLMGVPSKDYDVEVYGLSYSKIQEILSPYFWVDIVGQSFGVLKVGHDVDVALPRRESKNGIGHKGFSIESTPNLSPYEAFSRRDFTINSIGMRRDGSFFDPFDGIGDIKRKILRATGEAFKDDPLRVLRGMQFVARFGFSVDDRTIQYSREVFSEFSTLSEERIYEEWKKWALKGVYPEKGLRFLRDTGWVQAFPELFNLIDCPQNPKWHPEGDVWTHTLAVCREAVEATSDPELHLSEDEKLSVIFAALAHDFGKPSTTCKDENGELRSKGHAKAGAPLARAFYTRMKAPTRIVDVVEKLVAEHMATQLPDPLTVRTIRRLAHRLEPASIRLWTLLCRSDALGCGAPELYLDSSSIEDPKGDEVKAKILERKVRFQADAWLEAARQLELVENAPKPVVLGRDLAPLGVKPGPQMGIILKKLFEAQLDAMFSTREEGLEFLVKSRWLE